MKNNKNFVAILSIATGVICLIYFSTISFSVRISSIFTTPVALMPEQIAFPICAIALILSGLFGLFILNKKLKTVFDCAAVIAAAITISITPSSFIVYPVILIAIIKLLVQVLDKAPEKRLYFVFNKTNYFLVFDTHRPSFEDVCKSKGIELTERGNKPERKSKEKKIKKPAKMRKNKKYTGYAISPKARNYRKKARKKNSRR